MTTDEYGRTPIIIDGTKPGSVTLREKMCGRILVPRPVYDPANLPAFTNDQPTE